MLALNFALVGDYAPAVVGRRDAGDARIAVYFGAILARPAGERGGQIIGLNIAVLRVLNGAHQTVGVAHRPHRGDFIRRQKFDFNADGFAHTGVITIFIHAILGAGQPDVAHPPKPDR